MVKKILIFDYKFNVNNLEINSYGFNNLLLYIKNTNRDKLKIDFFINLCNFIIKEKSNLSNNLIKVDILDENIIDIVENNNEYNNLVEISCDFLNKKFNLNIDEDLNRLIKN
jgi:hypothetical protein